MNIVKVISTRIQQGRQLVKFLRYGNSDVLECVESSPYGIDSNPIRDMVAIYAKTNAVDSDVLIGYINKNRLSEVGENRLFSTDENGELSTFIWLKNDGTMEIGGNTDNMVRFSELQTAFNDLKQSVNDLTTAFNTHTHATAVPGPPVVPTPVPGVIPATPPTADVSGAKIEEIKTL